METLPRDLHYYICRYLVIRDVLHWSTCSRLYHEILADPRLWKMLFERDISSVIIPQDHRQLLIIVNRVKRIDDSNNLLLFSVTCGYEKLVEEIVRQNTTPHLYNSAALVTALEHGRLDIVKIVRCWTDAELRDVGKVAWVMLRHRSQPGYRECLRYYFSDIVRITSFWAVIIVLCSNDPVLSLHLRAPSNNDYKLVLLRSVLQRGHATREEIKNICTMWCENRTNIVDYIQLATEFEQYLLVEVLMELR